jgi:hypothetical protein
MTQLIKTVVVTALLSLFSVSCLKPPETKQNFGPEVDKSSVEKALNDIKTASPYSIEVGEFAYMEKLQQVESNPADVIFQRGDTIVSKREEPDYYVLTLVTEIREKIDGVFKPSKKETEAILPKINSMEQLAFSVIQNKSRDFAKIKSFEPSSIIRISQSDTSAKEKVTFHNLEVQNIRFPVPDLVKKRQNCGGLIADHCTNGIPATQISFDRVVWEERGGDKSSFRFTISEHSPYLASQLSACVQSRIDYQGQRIRVTQCELIKDFTWGTQASKIKTSSKK